jgi:hypothetical protein
VASRRDLLSSFLRPDRDITEEIRINTLPRFGSATSGINLEVAHGVVTLIGTPPAAFDHRAFTDLIGDVLGVIGISHRLTTEPNG